MLFGHCGQNKEGKRRKAKKIPTVGQTAICNHARIIVRWLLTITMLLALLPGMLCAANNARSAEIPPEAMALHAKLTPRVQPSVRTWIDEQAKRLSQGQMDEGSLHTGILNRFTGQPIKTGDVEAIKFLTQIQAIRYMDGDIREMNGKLKSIEEQKRELRAKISRQEADSKVAKRKPMSDDLKGKLDGMNEISEMTSLHLQMTMDRRSKFVETLSNIMKKVGTTMEAITQKLK